MSKTLTTDGLTVTSSGPALWGRRVALLMIALAVCTALVGGLGVHTAQKIAEDNGYRLTLSYPSAARAGLDVRWRVEVEHAGGFGKELTLAVSSQFFEIYETQGMWPDPSASTRDEHTTYLTFDAPEGDVFVLDYDAYVQPASQIGNSVRLAVIDDDQEQVALDYTTRLVP